MRAHDASLRFCQIPLAYHILGMALPATSVQGSGISDRTDFICPSGMIYNNGFLFDRLVSSPVFRACVVVTLWTWTKSSDKFGFRYVTEMAHEEMVAGFPGSLPQG